MARKNTLKTVYAALFAALIFVGTQFIKIPLPFGYFNLGDCFILICATVVGGFHAVFASAIGACLADILSGYGIYAPATFIIKSLMVIAMIFISRLGASKNKLLFFAIGAVISELIMVSGYFIYDAIIYGFAGAAASLWGNALQGVVAVAVSMLVITVLEKSDLLKRMKL